MVVARLRVVSDYDLTGTFHEVIDEFPFFVPSTRLASARPGHPVQPADRCHCAYLFLGAHGPSAPRLRLQISLPGFLVAALVLGGVAFLNMWDILVRCAAGPGVRLLHAHVEGWSGSPSGYADARHATGVVGRAPVSGLLGFLVAGRRLFPNIVTPRGAQLWVMLAPMLVPFCAIYAYLAWGGRRAAKWGLAIWLALRIIISLMLALALAGWIAWSEPATALGLLAAQGAVEAQSLVGAGDAPTPGFIGGLLTMLAVFVPAMAFVAAMRAEPAIAGDAARRAPMERCGLRLRHSRRGCLPFSADHSRRSVVIGPEFVYLRDQFGYRLNTIFKFYFQAWLLWSIPAALAVVILSCASCAAPRVGLQRQPLPTTVRLA